MPTTTNPGVLKGAITYLSICSLDAPSQKAASSNSIGIFSKYDLICI